MLASIHADMCASNPSFARFSDDMGLCEAVDPIPVVEFFEPYIPLSELERSQLLHNFCECAFSESLADRFMRHRNEDFLQLKLF